jgi:hypothetical protein
VRWSLCNSSGTSALLPGYQPPQGTGSFEAAVEEIGYRSAAGAFEGGATGGLTEAFQGDEEQIVGGILRGAARGAVSGAGIAGAKIAALGPQINYKDLPEKQRSRVVGYLRQEGIDPEGRYAPAVRAGPSTWDQITSRATIWGRNIHLSKNENHCAIFEEYIHWG